MFGVYVESCILHIKLCSVYKSRAVFYTKNYVRRFSRVLYFAHKTMFGVSVESCSRGCILHIKLCSVYKSRAVFYT